jgi:hypothetical protein
MQCAQNVPISTVMQVSKSMCSNTWNSIVPNPWVPRAPVLVSGQAKCSREASRQRGRTRCGCSREHSRAIAELGARGRSRLSLAHGVSARRPHLGRLSFRSHPPSPVTPSLGSYQRGWCPVRVAESRSRVRSASPSGASCSSRAHVRALRRARRRQWLFARR